MNQDSLWFGSGSSGDDVVQVRFFPDLISWQVQARSLLQQARPPERVWWHADTTCLPHVAEDGAAGAPVSGVCLQSAAPVNVPRSFLDKAQAAACHASADRWSLLYQILWRLVRGERHLMQLHGDPQVVKLNDYVKSVRRDVHKMKAFVRFRAVQDPGARDAADPRYVAWYEPDHAIVAYASGFFRRRFSNLRWSILTPQRCAHWEGEGRVWFTEGVGSHAAPAEDAFEAAWRLYYQSIFNPARLKVRAMLSEMPQKYWKNLPEARLIPSLVRNASRRLQEMQTNGRQADEPRCGPRPPGPQVLALERLAAAGEGTLEQLALKAGGCRRCPLWQSATQTVWGEGSENARVMIVGEQPGDREDLAGRPFVGPAGQLLDRALVEAGLDRSTLYLTNAVKHFKFRSRGKRRLHEKPSDAEMLACLPWLRAEVSKIEPDLVVCLGATAARAMLGRAVRINLERGRVLGGEAGGPAILLTFHPSYLLRLPDPAAAADAYEKLVRDLACAASWQAGPQGVAA